ncbi:MAG: hypothetical protein IT382_20160, partial [Deltaproteobacteria bacterium]|nr:hypothetical protein [Deltaproteobacteria bacterium]
MRRPRLRSVLPLLLAALTGACELTTPPFGRPCDEAAPCPEGYRCAEEACVPDELAG